MQQRPFCAAVVFILCENRIGCFGTQPFISPRFPGSELGRVALTLTRWSVRCHACHFKMGCVEKKCGIRRCLQIIVSWLSFLSNLAEILQCEEAHRGPRPAVQAIDSA